MYGIAPTLSILQMQVLDEQLQLLDISSNSNLPSVLFENVLKAFMTCCDLILNDAKRTEWSPIGSVIIPVIKQN